MARFPSVEWFEQVADRFHADHERASRLGYVEANVGVLVEDGASTKGFILEFAGYGPRAVREVKDPVAKTDFTIAGPLDAWCEMVRNIADHGEADLDHTLNRLTMAGVPLRLLSAGQLETDLFFRFNQSFQAFFNAAAGVPTEYPAAATV